MRAVLAPTCHVNIVSRFTWAPRVRLLADPQPDIQHARQDLTCCHNSQLCRFIGPVTSGPDLCVYPSGEPGRGGRIIAKAAHRLGDVDHRARLLHVHVSKHTVNPIFPSPKTSWSVSQCNYQLVGKVSPKLHRLLDRGHILTLKDVIRGTRESGRRIRSNPGTARRRPSEVTAVHTHTKTYLCWIWGVLFLVTYHVSRRTLNLDL